LLIADSECYYGLVLRELKLALSTRQPQRIYGGSRVPAAVLIPIYEKDEEHYVVFTERTHRVSTHKGQISFPGGSRDPGDASLLDTALRECQEEIGVPPEEVEVLGQLDDCPTYVSNYLITPFVGAIRWPHAFTISEIETASIIEAAVSELLDRRCLAEGSEIVDGKTLPAYFYAHREKLIWGATARIIKQFLEIWQAVAASSVPSGPK